MSVGGRERMGGPHPGDPKKRPRDDGRRSDERQVIERVLDEVDEELEQEKFDRC